jgi:thiol-disulfide isomerase/thioredoxin
MMWRTAMFLASMLVLGTFAMAGSVADLAYVSSILELTSTCSPQGVKLEASSPGDVLWPEHSENALYGFIPLAEGRHPLMVNRDAQGSVLYVDANLSGELQQFDWQRVLLDGSFLASVPFQIQYTEEQTVSYRAFVLWNPSIPTVVTYCRDSYRIGEIELADRIYSLAVVDEDSDGRYDDLDSGTLLLDTDRDGEFLLMSDSHEIFLLSEPFNLAGVVYEVAAMARDGSWIEIAESDAVVEPKYPLLVGFPATLFEGIDSNGNAFSLEALRGSVLVLDFWASWCGPCLAELPTLSALSDEFAASGVRVIGINLDRSESAFRAGIEDHEISYLQIYDSDRGPIGSLYRIAGIPMTYVIDRDGMITARGLRGSALNEIIRELVQNGS